MVVLGVVGGVGWLIYTQMNRPLPGEGFSELGREHVTDISNVVYNSNPPTSGPHFAAWAKAGQYDEEISDGYLLHSLEHGYVILSYDCEQSIRAGEYKSRSRNLHSSTLLFLNSIVHAHEDGEEVLTPATDSAQPLTVMKVGAPFTPETAPRVVALPEAFKSESCKNLAGQLAQYLKVAKKVIVVPKPGMDTPIALTSWGRILKLERNDKGKIEEFVKAWHDRGPEKTVE